MKRFDSRLFWGALLILMGGLFMLESLGLIALTAIWPLLFIVGGILFLVAFLLRKENWWAAIPGFTLLGLSTLIGADTFMPGLTDQWGGALFLGSISLGFLALYVRTLGRQWWALIPFGALATLAAIILLEAQLQLREDVLSGVLFLGIGLTFGLVYLLPAPQGRQKWAAIPAAILIALGLLGVIALSNLLVFVWPIALILLGVYILLRQPRARE